VSGTAAAPEGITNPPIDDLLEAAEGSKYGLVIYAAKRARQINAYYSQLGEGLLEYVGPLVETHVQEKPLSVALREIDAGLLTKVPVTGEESVGRTGGAVDSTFSEGFASDFGDVQVASGPESTPEPFDS
jgi:DNA-directed RNA polymerase subunit omega